MKTRFTILLAALMGCTMLWAQVHITVDDPETWSAQVLAPYIGQTVVFDVPMIVCSNANGNYTVSPWRKFEPLSQGVPGSDDYNETVRINNSCMFSLSQVSGYHRCGEKIYNLTAKVDKNSTTKLEMISGTWYGNTRADLEAALPDLGDYRLLVCGFNLENYYMTWGSMGADSYADHQKQRAQISKALKKINADVFGLVELQQGNEAIDEIVADLNNNLPSRRYAHFSDPGSGTYQKVDFVYDTKTVTPINTPVETQVETQNRKKMIAFIENATGERFIYSINHFKAMNSGGADRRTNEAQAVVKLYNSYRQNNSVRDNDILIMGDLNCYAYTDPIEVFMNSGMIDLHRAFHADSSYSYLFGGLASYIDHAITNETMLRQITGMSAYHINSDEDDKYTYDKSSDNTMFRCSDHDPVLVGLKLDSELSHPLDPYVSSANFNQDSLNLYYIYKSSDEDPLMYFDIYTIDGLTICPPTKTNYNGDILEEHAKYYTLSPNNPNIPEELKRFLPLPTGIYILHLYYKGIVTSHKLIIK